MKPNKVMLVGAAVLATGAALWGLGHWRRCATDTRKLQFATSLVDTGRAQEALAVINGRSRWPDDSRRQRAWLDVTVQALQQLGDAVHLGQIYYRDPELLRPYEEASLLAARALTLRRDMDGYERLRGMWRGRERSRDGWMILEADALLRRGRRAQALALLTEHRFGGKWEASRHVRLALLHAGQPEAAWQHLGQAVEHGDDAVARLFRAQLLEAAERFDEARLEYVAARLAQPGNAALCDQLAEFYRRRGWLQLMLETWDAADDEARADFIDLKSEFWRRVAVPLPGPHPDLAPGPLQPLVQALRSLPGGQFWDDTKLDQFEAHAAAQRRPEVGWLRVLELLRTRQEADAEQLLQLDRFADWAPGMRRTLLLTLRLRARHELDPNGPLRVDNQRHQPTATHPLVAELNEAHATGQAPDQLRRVLASPQGIPLALIAHGWFGAAVELMDAKPLPDDAPTWAAFGLTQAVRIVNGPQPALVFAQQQPASAALELLQCELLLQLEQGSQARQQLAVLGDRSDDVGQRANWLAVVSLLEDASLPERRRCQLAQQWLEQRPEFAATRGGQELLARLALLRHDPDAATAIYRELDDSVEAQVFLARSAVHDQQWDTAEQFTRRLLQSFPANQQLLHSLQQIQQQQAAAAARAPQPATAEGAE